MDEKFSKIEKHLVEAIRTDNLRSAQGALKSGADILSKFSQTNGRSILEHACRNSSIDVFMLFIKHREKDVAGVADTPLLHFSAGNKSIRVSKALLDIGCDASSLNHFSANTILSGARFNNFEYISMMSDLGVDPLARDKHGNSAMHYLCDEDSWLSGCPANVASYLKSVGLDVNAENYRGKTPLMFACDRYATIAAAKLVEIGADILCIEKYNKEMFSKLLPLYESMKLKSAIHGRYHSVTGGLSL